jgi:hypothetical protein
VLPSLSIDASSVAGLLTNHDLSPPPSKAHYRLAAMSVLRSILAAKSGVSNRL